MLKAFSYMANILSKFTVRYLETANTFLKRRRRACLNWETKLVKMAKKTGLVPTPLAGGKNSISFQLCYCLLYHTHPNMVTSLSEAAKPWG